MHDATTHDAITLKAGDERGMDMDIVASVEREVKRPILGWDVNGIIELHKRGVVFTLDKQTNKKKGVRSSRWKKQKQKKTHKR